MRHDLVAPERLACPTCGAYRMVVPSGLVIGSKEWYVWLRDRQDELETECQYQATLRH